MKKSTFRSMPVTVKLSTALSFLSSWIIFEEVIVDRYGIWKILPNYRVGFFCAWDLGALCLVVGGLIYISKQRTGNATIGA